MGSAVHPASTTPASWDAFSNVDAFVDEVLTELTGMAAEGTRTTGTGPKPALADAALRKAIMAVWCVCFRGMQWRATRCTRINAASDTPTSAGGDAPATNTFSDIHR